jgi:hypothetical protein
MAIQGEAEALLSGKEYCAISLTLPRQCLHLPPEAGQAGTPFQAEKDLF